MYVSTTGSDGGRWRGRDGERDGEGEMEREMEGEMEREMELLLLQLSLSLHLLMSFVHWLSPTALFCSLYALLRLLYISPLTSTFSPLFCFWHAKPVAPLSLSLSLALSRSLSQSQSCC